MEHAGDGPARAGAHIRRCPGDRSGDANAAEQRRGDIGDALRHQFAVGAVAAPGHAVGHDGGEQALDPPQQREGTAPPGSPRDLGQRERGKAAPASVPGMPPKRDADRLDRQVAAARRRRREATAIEQARPVRAKPAQQRDRRDRSDRERDGRRVDGRQRRGTARPASGQRPRLGAGRASGPRRSLTWLAKMIAAMPAVKPTVTG